ncbi:MAG: PDZ domain-containing protein [Actinomycetota bacterium]|nr:PDZ domain-containing protein [Actinomycetota bacterium]
MSDATQEPIAEVMPESEPRRGRALAISAATLLILVSVALLLPVPFVKLAPGPTYNVVGEVDGTEVIEISGTQTYPTTGDLDMTTVLESGGPRGGLTFVDAMASWFNSAEAVVPRELIYPDDVTGEDVQTRQAMLFNTSESDAIAAALNYLELPLRTEVVVTAVYSDTPAAENLEPKDQIISIDGVEVTEPKNVKDTVQSNPVGTTFDFSIDRVGEAKSISVKSADNPDKPGTSYIGIGVGMYYAAEFNINFTLQDVGGPSAGLMFSLGIIDKLTPGDLAKSRHIAGTGTMTPDGSVGAIGGIRQKLAGAKDAGAELFLIPTVHCKEAEGFSPEGLTVTPITTLTDAVKAVETWSTGGSVLRCPASAVS